MPQTDTQRQAVAAFDTETAGPQDDPRTQMSESKRLSHHLMTRLDTNTASQALLLAQHQPVSDTPAQ